MKKKPITVAIIVVLVICITAISIMMLGHKNYTCNINRVVGHSTLYDEELINKAFDVIEKEFAAEFEGCTLTELRYDAEVENRFADEISEYNAENNRELIVVLSTFDTDAKGGDGSLDPNHTYTNWQWHLARTADKKCWEVITWGYG